MQAALAKGLPMSSTTAPMIPLAAQRPTPPPKPASSRASERPSGESTFGAALRAAANEAMLAQLQIANPSAARIGAPPDSSAGAPPVAGLPVAGPPDAGVTGMAMPIFGAPPPPAGVDARLWESLTRGAQFAGLPANAAPLTPDAITAMTAGAQQLAPSVQAIAPAMIREQGQAFLRSIKGFDQTSVGEYESAAQARAWGHSTCSAASLTAVLRAAGQDVKIADVMKAMPGGMTIKLGLVSRPSLVNAANQFGARAADDVKGYEALKEATDAGQPVLVSIRNGKFPEGHWIVVTGVDADGIRCADSSRYDMTSMSRAEFTRSWDSRGIRLEGLTPIAAPARANIQSA
jgi:hypothetical protein